MAHFRNMVRTACTCAYASAAGAQGGAVAAAWVTQPARVDVPGLAAGAAELAADTRVLSARVLIAVSDPAHAATREAQLRPGGDARIAAALLLDTMREDAARALLARVRGVLQDHAPDKDDPQGARVAANVYRLLGRWDAPRDVRDDTARAAP